MGGSLSYPFVRIANVFLLPFQGKSVPHAKNVHGLGEEKKRSEKAR
jgi:hypothetical protein